MTKRDRPADNADHLTLTESALMEAVKAEVLDWFGGAPEWRNCSQIEAELVAQAVLRRLQAP